MVDKELIAYTKQVLEKGYNKKEIEEHLAKHGHTKETIKEVFSGLDYQELGKLQKKIPPKKKSHPQFIYIIAAIIFVGVLVVGIYFLSKNLNLSFSNNCEEVSLKLYEVQSKPVLCAYRDNSKIQMILENKGNETIGKIDIIIKGSRRTVKDSLDNLRILSKQNSVEQGDHLFTRVIPYGKENGDVKSVELIPYLLDEDNYVKCSNKKIIVEEISTC